MREQFTSCLLCDSDRLYPLKGYEKHYLQKCENCGFVFCSRKPTEQELIAHYNLYTRNDRISPITIKRYEALLDTFEKYRRSNNIIDVGCGEGFFLQVAKQREWNVYGTEFTDHAVDICSRKGIDMKKGKLDDANYPKGFFDVVTSFEVIEHINNPNDEVGNFNKILRAGGMMYVTTPNFNSISRDWLGAKWNVIEYPEHLSYYTTSTITKLFLKAGFKSLKVTTSGLSIDRLRAGMRYAQAAAKSRPAGSDEGLRKSAEGNWFYKWVIKAINFGLDIAGKGDSLKGMFVKRREG